MHSPDWGSYLVKFDIYIYIASLVFEIRLATEKQTDTDKVLSILNKVLFCCHFAFSGLKARVWGCLNACCFHNPVTNSFVPTIWSVCVCACVCLCVCLSVCLCHNYTVVWHICFLVIQVFQNIKYLSVFSVMVQFRYTISMSSSIAWQREVTGEVRSPQFSVCCQCYGLRAGAGKMHLLPC